MRNAILVGPRGLRLRVGIPERRLERASGLMGRSALAQDEALLLFRTRSVHTFGMRFPISVALVDADLVVRSVLLARPGRLVLPRPGVHHVLELAEAVDVRPGDRFRMLTDRAGIAIGPAVQRDRHGVDSLYFPPRPGPGGGCRWARAPIV